MDMILKYNEFITESEIFDDINEGRIETLILKLKTSNNREERKKLYSELKHLQIKKEKSDAADKEAKENKLKLRMQRYKEEKRKKRYGK